MTKTLPLDLAYPAASTTSIRHDQPATAETPRTFEAEIEVRKDHRVWIRYHYVTQATQLAHCLAGLQARPIIGVDVETSGLKPFEDRIATLQVGYFDVIQDVGEAWVIDVRGMTADDLAPLFAILTSRRVTKLGQNIGFEYRFLRHHYDVRLRKLADTQVAELVLRAGLFESKAKRATTGERTAYKYTSMAELMLRYAGIVIDKDEALRTSFYKTPKGKHTERQIIYAASDVIYPFVIAAGQRPVVDERGLRDIIKLEMECIPVIAEMEHRGFRLDQKAWTQLWQEALRERRRYEEQLDDLIRPCTLQLDMFERDTRKERPIHPKTNKPINYGSPEQVKWVIKTYCRHVQWPLEVVTDLKRLRALKEEYGGVYLDERPDRSVDDIPEHFIPESQYCVLMDADKKTLILRKARRQLPAELVDALIGMSKYDQRVTSFGFEWMKANVRKATGRIHPQVHQAITSTGRVSTQPNCYDEQTEILTKSGWKRFAALQEGEAVAQVDPATLAISFVVPTERYAAPYQGPMVHWSTEQIDLLVTPHHRMLIENRRSGRREVIRADECRADKKHFHAGQYVGGAGRLTPDEVRFLVAVQADGSWTKGGALDFRLRKERKVSRLREMLARLDEEQYGRVNARGVWQWRLPKAHRLAQLALEYLGTGKRFGAWILDLSRSALDAVVDEVWYWDGYCAGRSQYCSVDQVNAEWVATACALSGVRARLRPYVNTRGVQAWVVDTRWVPHSMTAVGMATTVPYDGMVYCVTVPTGMVLVRRMRHDGRIVTSVSGNTQNIPSDSRYRKCFIPGPGFKFVIADYSQQEPRLLAQVSKDPTYLNTYANNDDLYLAVAENMLGYRPDKKTPEGALERQMFKAIVLAMAYRSGPAKLRDQLTLGLADAILAGHVEAPTLEFAQRMHRRFFEAHGKVKEYQDRCSKTASPKEEDARRFYDALVGDFVTAIRAPCGRMRFFPPDAKNTYTEASNAPIQGGSATMTKAAAAMLQRYIDEQGWQDLAFVVNLVHDEIVCEVHESIAEPFAHKLQEFMEEAGRFYCPDVPIVAEFPKGSNGVVEYWTKELE